MPPLVQLWEVPLGLRNCRGGHSRRPWERMFLWEGALELIDMINMSRTQKKGRINGGRNSCSGQKSSFSKGYANNVICDQIWIVFRGSTCNCPLPTTDQEVLYSFPLFIFTLKISLLPLYKSKAYPYSSWIFSSKLLQGLKTFGVFNTVIIKILMSLMLILHSRDQRKKPLSIMVRDSFPKNYFFLFKNYLNSYQQFFWSIVITMKWQFHPEYMFGCLKTYGPKECFKKMNLVLFM